MLPRQELNLALGGDEHKGGKDLARQMAMQMMLIREVRILKVKRPP